ncbi:unnamed protein product [Hyaloperonospora brassicae]|uniref:Mediator of RNA polymerase II transcription subunit 10 n=1 Tax=Hyaloperonospora brassicae TaxID=162125 RepID=A0AAV0UWS4_HYABA|nr:unnamed protein product [Hyaloperonospora brassicae]
MECRPKGLDDDDADVEPDQFLSDLPPLDRADSQNAATSAAGLQPTPSAAPASAVSEPHERRAQVGASPYLAPFTPSGSPPQNKTPIASKGRGTNNVKPQLQPMPKDGRHAGYVHPVLLQDDVVKHLPPRVLETLVDIVATLDQLTDGVADFRPDQLNFLSEKATRYVELLQQADQAAAAYDADIPLQVLQNMDATKDSNPELFTKTQLEKCSEESQQAAAKVETLSMLKGALQAGLQDL